jgi:hypothetical protein
MSGDRILNSGKLTVRPKIPGILKIPGIYLTVAKIITTILLPETPLPARVG